MTGVNRLRALSFASLIAVYSLILAGGIVRSTGSGMGCPDWPRCFGRWIPPTNASELVENYKDIYAQKRKIKNYKVASYLRLVHLNKLALAIEGDDTIYQELDFNPLKTWIEYINRLLGVIVGILIFILLIYSIRYYHAYPGFTFISLLTVMLVGIEGWMGSLVVSTNLLPFIITAHMAGALLIILALTYLFQKASIHPPLQVSVGDSKVKFFLIANCLLVFIQVIFGTQVRENIDVIAKSSLILDRQLWINQLGLEFLIHRSFSLLVFAISLCMIFYLKSIPQLFVKSKGALLTIVACLVLEIILGVGLAYFGFSPFLQPLHLFFGCLLFGASTYLLFGFFAAGYNTKKLAV